MAISNKIKNMLNRGGISAANAFGTNNLGTVFQTIAAAVDDNTTDISTAQGDITDIETAAAKTEHIKHTIVSGDINTGVVSITLSGAFDSFDPPILTTSAGVTRTVTAVAITSSEGVYTLSVTCSAVIATDILHITVHKTT